MAALDQPTHPGRILGLLIAGTQSGRIRWQGVLNRVADVCGATVTLEISTSPADGPHPSTTLYTLRVTKDGFDVVEIPDAKMLWDAINDTLHGARLEPWLDKVAAFVGAADPGVQDTDALRQT